MTRRPRQPGAPVHRTLRKTSGRVRNRDTHSAHDRAAGLLGDESTSAASRSGRQDRRAGPMAGPTCSIRARMCGWSGVPPRDGAREGQCSWRSQFASGFWDPSPLRRPSRSRLGRRWPLRQARCRTRAPAVISRRDLHQHPLRELRQHHGHGCVQHRARCSDQRRGQPQRRRRRGARRPERTVHADGGPQRHRRSGLAPRHGLPADKHHWPVRGSAVRR